MERNLFWNSGDKKLRLKFPKYYLSLGLSLKLTDRTLDCSIDNGDEQICYISQANNKGLDWPTNLNIGGYRAYY